MSLWILSAHQDLLETHTSCFINVWVEPRVALMHQIERHFYLTMGCSNIICWVEHSNFI